MRSRLHARSWHTHTLALAHVHARAVPFANSALTKRLELVGKEEDIVEEDDEKRRRRGKRRKRRRRRRRRRRRKKSFDTIEWAERGGRITEITFSRSMSRKVEDSQISLLSAGY